MASHTSLHVMEVKIRNGDNGSMPYNSTQMSFLCSLFFPFSSFPVSLSFILFFLSLPLHLPLLPGSSGFFRRTNIPPGVYKLRVVAWDPVRDERAVIRNRILVHRDDTFCAVLKTNNGVTIGRNNNVTVEFSGTGRTTGFQCILDKQQPYFECMLFCGFILRFASMFCLPVKLTREYLNTVL